MMRRLFISLIASIAIVGTVGCTTDLPYPWYKRLEGQYPYKIFAADIERVSPSSRHGAQNYEVFMKNDDKVECTKFEDGAILCLLYKRNVLGKEGNNYVMEIPPKNFEIIEKYVGDRPAQSSSVPGGPKI